LTEREDCFSVSELAVGLGDSASLGFLAIGNGDGLGGTLGHGVRPDAIMHTRASHGVGLSDFKSFHCFNLLCCNRSIELVCIIPPIE
jgi:hypothetical protein